MSETVTTVDEVGQAVSKCLRRDPDRVSYHASELAEAAHAAPVNALALKVAGAERKAFKLQRLGRFEKALQILEKLIADEELKGDAQRQAWLAATAARIAYQMNNEADLGAGGALSNRRVWATTFPRAPDGITLDADGAIWIASPGTPECVRVAPGRKVLEIIDTGQPCYACMLGGDAGRTLFMLTAPRANAIDRAGPLAGKLLVAEVEAPHAGLP